MKHSTLYTAFFILMFTAPTWAAEKENHKHGNEHAVENNEKHEEERGDEKDDHGHENEHKDEHGKKNDTHDEKHDKHAKEKDDHGDGHEGHDENGDEEGGIKLMPKQLNMGGIVVSELRPSKIHKQIRAPGEVVFNNYRSKKITTRISAQVVKRHTQLGEHIQEGQPLVALSSVEMADVQSELLITGREWQRVKKLSRKVVSE